MREHVLVLLATMMLAALSSGAVAQAPAQQQAAPDILEYKGIVAAAREAEVAPRLDGLLSKINFNAGQVVKEGDLLFEFASKSNELSLALAQANLKQAEAQLGLAEVNLKNKQTLRARNVGSEMELLEMQAQREIAAAKVEEARANVAIAEIALQQTKLYAPISGVISRPLIKEGAYITKEAAIRAVSPLSSSSIRSTWSVKLQPLCTFSAVPHSRPSSRPPSSASSVSSYQRAISIHAKVVSSPEPTSSTLQRRPPR